ncbi:hypothetical protein DID75_04710 [Candidatus Marinamargulisbacteria bacterium SCGC AG-410-N11]|nr:hypothetical protein DID75_04710 [Candidatus Marinamargulisbacteria bacterium SCGC AG-410-N11]
MAWKKVSLKMENGMVLVRKYEANRQQLKLINSDLSLFTVNESVTRLLDLYKKTVELPSLYDCCWPTFINRQAQKEYCQIYGDLFYEGFSNVFSVIVDRVNRILNEVDRLLESYDLQKSEQYLNSISCIKDNFSLPIDWSIQLPFDHVSQCRDRLSLLKSKSGYKDRFCFRDNNCLFSRL